ncbi:microtubule-associated protein 9 isoform X2 [Brachyhypopomus gauderio]|uniref:microtubule-associated protein 9 isoform X2 n=1 Tax=Brachyhypopomus gauderio TaxID=698409 RepID=UPI004043059F
MGDGHVHTTLAYTKSPKTSRRTSFQEELESAVSARASRHKPTDSNAYLDDFDEDEDDILSELLKTRRKKIDMFKSGKSKAKMNDFHLSDDEEENIRPKKVSFMKTKRKSSPVQDALFDSGKTDTTGGAESPGSFDSYHGCNTALSTQELLTPDKEQQDAPFASQTESQAALKNQLESPLGRKNQLESPMSRKSLSESPLPLNSENSQWEHPLHLLSEGLQLDNPLPLPSDTPPVVVRGNGGSPIPQPRERSTRQMSPRGIPEGKPPRPVPRQKVPHMDGNVCDEGDGPAETLFSKAAPSSTSITLWPNERASALLPFSESAWASGSDYVQCEDDHHAVLNKASMSSSSVQQQRSEATNSSLLGPREWEEITDPPTPRLCDWSGLEQDKKEDSMPFKEYQEGCPNTPHLTASRQSEIRINSQNRPPSSRPLSSRKSKNTPYTAESRYLGTLKILDQKMTLEGTQPNAADSLRAAVYQDWLRKKQEELQATLRVKKQEEKLKQDKKTEDESSKKVDAEASYEAWKKKKCMDMRGKLREKEEALKKQQREASEKEEKKETAKKVFEKWKEEHDDLLREQLRKQVQAEARLQEKKVKDEEERKRECSSSFSQWSERKKEAILEKARVERRRQEVEAVEEKYEKEEREKEASETYERWLRRKELLQKRERHDKKIRAIVQEETPPPWSPPGRTVPFGK